MEAHEPAGAAYDLIGTAHAGLAAVATGFAEASVLPGISPIAIGTAAKLP